SPNPALVNNAQTFAHVPSILRLGGDSFREIGTRDTPGTLLFTLSGDVQKPGVYELPAGPPLRRVFDEIGGGARPGRRFKVALSGVSAKVLLEDRFDTPADFASLHLAGGSLGSAGFIVLDDSAWMPRVAQSLARFLYVESCNQCSACKHGLRTASSAIDELFDPELATPDDFERALYGARSAPQGNRCYLPVQGSIVIPNLLSRFRDEFTAQLASPDRPSARYVVPVIVDFDEATSTFTYDLDRERKQPNWTYAEPAPPSLRPAAKPVSQGGPPRVPANVRLHPDVHDAVVKAAAQRGHEVERVVNEALRAWVSRERNQESKE
ncbi:MAG: NADH-ubiquinone oxidoreductase-F iron-sulfur binding region domain-containing protein, partial [Byssovorax sp.]